MGLSDRERIAVVRHKLQRAKETLIEAQGSIELKHWHAAANRLYYACYYAVNGLLINGGYVSKTHSGIFSLLGEHFVSIGLINKEQNKFYRRVLELRQAGDYDDWLDLTADDILPLLEPAKDFIETIEKVVKNENLNHELSDAKEQ
jgi:uncharacterized protein (UPF0332 family)